MTARARWPERLSRWAALVLYMAAIFVGSSIPGDQVPVPGIWKVDKLVHAAAFAGLAMLAFRALRRFWPAALLASAYGALDEIHQYFTPKRSADVFDWIADTVGALAGAALALAVTRALARGRGGAGAGGAHVG